MLELSIGKVIREIRKNKNIPSNKVYTNLLSRPAIAKFEKGLSDTTVEKFFTILSNLNITLEEFDVIYAGDENKDLEYNRLYMGAYYKKDINALKNIADKAAYDYTKTNNEKFRHYKAISLLLIDELNEGTDYQKEIEFLQSYLISCNVWGYYEVTLFTNTISFFTSDLIDLVYIRAKKVLINRNLKRYRNELAILLFNIIEMKIVKKQERSANHYFEELQNLKLDVLDNMYIQVMIKYFQEILLIIEQKEDRETVNRIIEMFDFIGMESKKHQCSNFYGKIKLLYL